MADEPTDLERMRKGAMALLEALGPEKPKTMPPVEPPVQPNGPANDGIRKIVPVKDEPFCKDCDTGERYASLEDPEKLIGSLNKVHKHGDFLSCKTCRPAMVKAFEDMGYDVDDEGVGEEMTISPKKKR
jgi:hypothetical protein